MHAGVAAFWQVLAAASLDDWGVEPAISLPVLLLGVLYIAGLLRVRRRAPHAIPSRDVACFAAGYAVLCVALVSPLHGVSEQIFTAHMIQHELLMVLAAPLLVLARPGPIFLWAFAPATRRQIAGVLRRRPVRRAWSIAVRPLDAWLLHGVVIWVWHIPLLFQATLHSDVVHAAQHASFLGSALLFWWSITHGMRRAARGMAIVYLFTTVVHTGVLGALMAFAHSPWYPEYASTAVQWGLTPMGDQQLAGLVMWVPASAAYLVAALAIMRAWLRDSEWSVTETERARLAISS